MKIIPVKNTRAFAKPAEQKYDIKTVESIIAQVAKQGVVKLKSQTMRVYQNFIEY